MENCIFGVEDNLVFKEGKTKCYAMQNRGRMRVMWAV